jgi:hypothetical protein
MQEIAFPGFKFQNFSGIIPLISNDKLRLINILFYFLCIFFLLLFQIQVWLA